MFYFLSGGLLANANDNIVNAVTNPFRTGIGNVLNVIRLVGTGLALIMLTWMSISYFTANGRGAPFAAERQADIKGKQLMRFAIGAAVFIGASNLLYYVTLFVIDVIGDMG